MAATAPDRTSTAPDYDEIVRVVQLYVDGFNSRDVNKFKQAFHESAWIFFTDAGGTLHKSLLLDEFEGWIAPPKSDVVGRIISVIQAGDVAVVQLGFDDRGKWGSWLDFHALLRIDGAWKI